MSPVFISDNTQLTFVKQGLTGPYFKIPPRQSSRTTIRFPEGAILQLLQGLSSRTNTKFSPGSNFKHPPGTSSRTKLRFPPGSNFKLRPNQSSMTKKISPMSKF